MFDNMFKGVVGKIQAGCCRLSMDGRIAIKTSDGYKTYNPKTGNVTNCSNFVLEADDLFMVIPTRTLKAGDIVLINGKPMYIIEVKEKNRVEAMSYEDSTIQTVIPERHAIMGRRFYGKIVSLLGGFGKGNGKGGFFKNMLKFKMMSSMMGGGDKGGFSGNGLAMMMLMGNGSMDGLFDGFDDDDDEDCDPLGGIFDETEDDEEDEKPAKKAKKAAAVNPRKGRKAKGK